MGTDQAALITTKITMEMPLNFHLDTYQAEETDSHRTAILSSAPTKLKVAQLIISIFWSAVDLLFAQGIH